MSSCMKIVLKGVYVTKVNSDSPADVAGIKLGEVVEEINGNQVNNSSDFLKCIGYQ